MQLSSASILLLLGAGVYILYQCLLSPLARIPGPFLAKVTNWHRAWYSFQGQSHRDVIALHRKYGPVVRIAPNHLLVNFAWRCLYAELDLGV